MPINAPTSPVSTKRPDRNIPIALRRKFDGAPCAICGRLDDIEIDHIRPVKKGGRATSRNLQALCRVCNAIKRDRRSNDDVRAWIALHPEEFARKQELRTSRLEHFRLHGPRGYF